MLRKRKKRQRREKPKAAIDMTSLIDLTFLLLVTFIVTLPALEQGISIKLPAAKTDELPTKDNKANTVTLTYPTGLYFNDNPTTIADLREVLKSMVAEDADTPVLVRGDVRLDYGSIMEVVKVLYDVEVRRMALVTVEK